MRRSFSLIALVLLVAACDTDPTSPASLTPDELRPSLALSASNSVSESQMGPGPAKMDGGAHHACVFYPQDGNVDCLGVYPVENYSPRADGSGWYGERADYTGGDAIAASNGGWTNCVLLATGNTHCWGEKASEFAYAGGDAIQMAVGYTEACVLTDARNVNCIGHYTGRIEKMASSGAAGWKEVYSGGDAEWVGMGAYAYCIKTEGTNTLTCGGAGVTKHQWVTTGTPAPQVVGHYTMCVRMAEGTVECMDQSSGHGNTKVPAGLTGIVDVDAHAYSTCAALSNGDITCWGRDPVKGLANQVWTYAGVGAVNVAVSEQDVCYATATGTTACIRSTPDAYAGGVRDASPPVITPTVSGTVGQNGWYTSDVQVSWSATDGESSVSSTSGCDPSTLSSDTDGASFTCKATSEGGTASETVTVKLDATAPALAFSGNQGTYTVDQKVEIGCSASDATSGLAASDCPEANGDAYTFALGSNTRSATATDHAGNTAAASVDFTVQVTAGSLCALTQRWVSKAGVAHSLCKQIENNAISAYQNHLRAQTGKSITPAHAEILHRLANGL